MTARYLYRFHAALERRLPEQRLFLKSDTETRFIRLRPMTQALVLAGCSLVVGWAIIASAIVLMDSIGSGNARERARLEQAAFENRLNELSIERDQRAAEAAAAQQRFTVALEQVSTMQSALLASEERRRELETGIGVIQTTLRRTMTDRDAARQEVAVLSGEDGGAATGGARVADVTATLDFLSDALGRTAEERDAMATEADAAESAAEDVALEMKLMEERNDEIFAQLEEAVTVSMEPLDEMFASVGMDAESLLDQVRQGYSGQGGPLGPLAPESVPGATSARAAADLARAERIFDGLDRLNLYRIAVEKSPFAMPLDSSFRYTSGFGRRWGRKHEGIDLAGRHGTPILATADGVVVHAGWENGYGNLVRVKHEFGMETYYGHLSKVRVEVGQNVSRGETIGDMGNTGRSTGTHLHYEVHVGGTPVNPMTFIKAANNVF